MNADFKIDGKTVETDRLLLRPFQPKDLDDLYEYASVAGVGEMAGWKHHESKDETRKILDMFIREDKVFAVCHKEDRKVIGSLGVENYGREKALTEFDGYMGRAIGYVLSKAYWGREIMPEAVRAVIDFLFHEKKLDFLICAYYLFNNQSKRVQEKCGFKPYRRLTSKTAMGTEEPSILTLLVNPEKNVTLRFSHPETLIYKD